MEANLLLLAKEALYKAYKKAGIHFNTQLLIAPFDSLAKKGSGSIFHDEKKREYELDFRYYNNYCLTIATPIK